MEHSQLETIAAERFGLQLCAPTRAMSAGNINKTGVVTTVSGSFVLQDINPLVFPDPALLIDNARKIISAQADHNLPTLDMVRAGDGEFFTVVDGTPWRCYRFIEGEATPPITTNEEAQATARSFGRYAKAIAELELVEHISGYHDFDARVEAFELALATDSAGRAAECRQVLAELLAVVDRVRVTFAYQLWKDLPIRNAHNDAKGPNCVIGSAGRAIIDLDTTMPGTLLSDIGELVRSSTRHLGAAGPEVLMAQIASVNRGFLAGYGHGLDNIEDRAMLLAGPLLTVENAVRFMTDHLSGDVYYGAAEPNQNRERAVEQLRLAERLVEAIELATSGGLSAA